MTGDAGAANDGGRELARIEGLAWLLPIVVCALYIGLYVPYGLSDTDEGYITGTAWRIVAGQVPYADFEHVRPPLSLYLQAGLQWSLPDHNEFLITRAWSYVALALAAAWGALLLRDHFDFRAFGVAPGMFAAIAFVLAAHNFPPMPWHTVDGIFFAALSAWLLFRQRPWPFIAGLAVVAAALCKQSFYPLVPGYLVLALLAYGLRIQALTLLLGIATGIGAFVALLSAYDLADPFLAQTSATTSFSDLLVVFERLVMRPFPILIAIFTALPVFTYSDFARNRLGFLLILGVFALSLGFNTADVVLTRKEHVLDPIRWSEALFLVSVTATVALLFRYRPGFIVLGALLTISLCAAISWGYPKPILYSLPLLFGFAYLLHDMVEIRPQPFVWPVLLVMALAATWLQSAHPYREMPRISLGEDLGQVYPKLTGIRSSTETLAMWQEFKSLHEEYGNPFTVLPGLPLAHYASGTVPTFPVDWARDLEMPGEQARYLEALSDHVILVAKQSWSACDSSESVICARVLEMGNQIAETEYFRVFELPAAAD